MVRDLIASSSSAVFRGTARLGAKKNERDMVTRRISWPLDSQWVGYLKTRRKKRSIRVARQHF